MTNSDPAVDAAANLVRDAIRVHASGSVARRFCMEIAIAVRLLEDAAASAASLARPELSGSIIEKAMALWRLAERVAAGGLLPATRH